MADDDADVVQTEFATYEDYLDSQIKPVDMFYLGNEDLARQLVELGQRGNGDVMTREEFDLRKREIEEQKFATLNKQPKSLCHQGKDLSGKVFLQALASREENVRNGKLTSIIFIRDRNHLGQEISGYIDYAHRLKVDDNFPLYFAGEKKLLPKPSDLSYFNWETQTCTSNPTPNFQVIADSETGLLFKNKRDRKTINVDPKAYCGDNSSRHEITDPEYIQIVIYDHQTRRKT